MPGRKSGLTYSSYHPRARYVKFSFDQTIAEDGDSNLQYTLFGSGDNNAMKMRDNGGKLVIDLQGGSGAKTSKADTVLISQMYTRAHTNVQCQIILFKSAIKKNKQTNNK